MKIKEKIGLIGVGNMGAAIVKGVLESEKFAPKDFMVYDKVSEKSAMFAARWNTAQAESNLQIAKNCSVVVLAVKPQDLAQTIQELGDFKEVVAVHSILAGTPIAKLKELIKKPVTIVRAMPNLGATVGESITALASHENEALNLAEMLFSCCGKVVVLEEKYFDLVTAISGSGPAYFFLLMELLVNEGVRNGLKTSEAQLLAVQTALGAAKLAENVLGNETPEELRKKVTSKGGTTEAALNIFDKHKISEIVSEAVTAAINRGKELSKG